MSTSERDSVAAWAKRCYFAGRAQMETALRPHSLGSTQWYVLHKLVHDGPTKQKDVQEMLQVERATLSGILAVLVGNGLVEQVPDPTDHRQKSLQITASGASLWKDLPDLNFIREVAFGGIDPADITVAVRVLRRATEQLEKLNRKGKVT